MGLDIAAASPQGVATQEALQKLYGFCQPFHARAGYVDMLAVAEKQLDHRGQVFALPAAVHVGLSATQRAIQHYPGIEVGIRDSDADRPGENAILSAEDVLLVAVIDHEFAMTQAFQSAEDGPFGIVSDKTGFAALHVGLVDR